jgi:ribosomal protein S18 acetylase RimI-like enzyme
MDTSLVPVAPADWPALAGPLFEWNRRPDGGVHCLHAEQGDDLEAHRAELAALPTGEAAFWTLPGAEGPVGVVGCEIDAALQRAWLRGPLVAQREVLATLLPLIGPALEAALPGIRQFDGFTAADGPWLNEWYAAAGFEAMELHRLLQADTSRMPMPAGVQRAGRDDIAAAAALHLALFPSPYLGEAEFVHALDASDRVLFVARGGDGAPLGYLHAEDRPLQQEAYVDYLGVHPAQRGRGFGRALLQAALAWAAERGRPRIALTVREDRRSAINLYRGAGFEEIRTGRHWRRRV